MAEASGAIEQGEQETGGTPPDPLDRPVASWGEGDVRTVLNSPADLRSGHPRHREAQRMVRLWFEQEFGTGQVAPDASGRIVHDRPRRRSARATSQGTCPVPVRAHAREGGMVEVREHCRARPA